MHFDIFAWRRPDELGARGVLRDTKFVRPSSGILLDILHFEDVLVIRGVAVYVGCE